MNARGAVEAAIEDLLRANGITFDAVAVVGHAADLAAIAAPTAARTAVAVLSGDIKALGVRYVTLDLKLAYRHD